MTGKGGARKRYTVLYLTAHPDLSGAERYLIDLVRHLDRERFRPVVLVPREGRLAGELVEAGIDVRVIDLGVLHHKRELYSPRLLLRLLSLLASVVRVALLIRRERVDLVNSNTIGVWSGALAARLTGVPHVWHVREILTQPRWLWKVMRLLIPMLSARVICTSAAVREHFQSAAPRSSKLLIVHDGIDAASMAEDLDEGFDLANGGIGSLETAPTVGMLARVNPWKGQDVFVQAAHLVLQKHPRAQFHLAGGCLPVYQHLQRRLEKRIATYGMATRVHLLGSLSPRQAAAFISQLDILVVPSTSPDPFPRTVLEGMAFAIPVIASDAGGPREVIVPGVTGLLVAPGNPDALARAITELLDDACLRDSMGRAGKARLAEHFDLGARVGAIERIYRQLARS